jgi:mannose-6-phosphate isomerase
MTMLQPFMLEPIFRDYVWGGKRLRPDAEITAEAWIVYEENRVSGGPYAGKTLAQVADVEREALLGTSVVAQTGIRFPLLIKLLDCADWLSLQVHPNNEQAKELEGPGNFGKTEAWYVVEADDGAQLLAGLKEGVKAKDMETSLRKGQILSLTQQHDVQTGDAIFIPAGMIHALGPGLLIYEVQQTSNTTYRVYDWDRPMTAGRQLHIEQAAKVLNPELCGELIAKPERDFEGTKRLISSQYFVLDLIAGQDHLIENEPQPDSFSTITVLDGRARIIGPLWEFTLNQFETLVIPAIWDRFKIELIGQVRALRSAAL